jgi:oligoendopeptidase F
MSEIKTRAQVPVGDTWDLTLMYANNEAWEAELAEASQFPQSIPSWSGRLSESPAVLKEALDARFGAERVIVKLYVYAHLLNDQDLDNSAGQDQFGRARSLYYQFHAASAFFEPEILSLEAGTLASWLESEELQDYRFFLDDLLRQKPYTMTPGEERLLAMASEALAGTTQVFSMLNNIEIPERFPDVLNEEGKEQKLTSALYGKLSQSKERKVRRSVFRGLHSSYKNNRSSLAACLQGSVKAKVFNAKARGFDSALHAALFADNISVEVYNSLINTTHSRLEDYYRYVDIRKKAMGLDELHIYDQSVPLITDFDKLYEWDEAEQMILDALTPLGEEYKQIVKEAFNKRWIDRYENKGKRSGAYSSGCYDSAPYILHNYNGTLRSVFTLMHELGHSLHSYLARKTQPYHTASYTIFVAEVASTVNEGLLLQHLLKNSDDDREKAFLINHYLNGFRGTFFRQTMFAEFEKKIYELVEAGQVLTADLLDETYYALNKLYYGDGLAWNAEDELIAHEWSRVPHFYYNFYVYKYATGIVAATSLVQQILGEGEPAVDRYLNFLKAGGSNYSLDILKGAGVDLTTPTPIVAALDNFVSLLDQWDALNP